MGVWTVTKGKKTPPVFNSLIRFTKTTTQRLEFVTSSAQFFRLPSEANLALAAFSVVSPSKISHLGDVLQVSLVKSIQNGINFTISIAINHLTDCV